MDNTKILTIIGLAAAGAAGVALSRLFFRKFASKYLRLRTKFSEQVASLLIIVVCLINIMKIFDPTVRYTSILLRGSALVVAIIGFAAQPVIADMVCGYLIRINRPFDIGDRIIVDDLEPGIVEDITMRHTVVRIYDGMRMVIPNSQLNSRVIINTSVGDRKGIHLYYSVSYDTDLELAMNVLRDAVVSSPYSLAVEKNGIHEDSGPVYFRKFGSSALILETTLWIGRNVDGHAAETDVNTRVVKAFRENGIEIPYNYMNVISREQLEEGDAVQPAERKGAVKRYFHSDTIDMKAGNRQDVAKVLKEAERFAARQQMDEKATRHLRLITEEAVTVSASLTDYGGKMQYWVDGSGITYRVHMLVFTAVDIRTYHTLQDLSSTGRIDNTRGLRSKIMELFRMYSELADVGQVTQQQGLTWSLREYEKSSGDYELGRSILAALSDDIKVSVSKGTVGIVITKTNTATDKK